MKDEPASAAKLHHTHVDGILLAVLTAVPHVGERAQKGGARVSLARAGAQVGRLLQEADSAALDALLATVEQLMSKRQAARPQLLRAIADSSLSRDLLASWWSAISAGKTGGWKNGACAQLRASAAPLSARRAAETIVETFRKFHTTLSKGTKHTLALTEPPLRVASALVRGAAGALVHASRACA